MLHPCCGERIPEGQELCKKLLKYLARRLFQRIRAASACLPMREPPTLALDTIQPVRITGLDETFYVVICHTFLPLLAML